MNALHIPVSFGEATDRVTILELKRERITDPGKVVNIEAQLGIVRKLLFERALGIVAFDALFEKLKTVNAKLWDVEEKIRDCEQRGEFGPEFIKLARSVYQTNDERARVKRALDVLFGSAMIEEKSYIEHAFPADLVPSGDQNAAKPR